MEISLCPSIEHEQVVEMMNGGLGLEELSVDEQRAVMEASADMFPAEADVLASEVDAGGVPADWVTVNGSNVDRVILYLHGGGYTMGSRTPTVDLLDGSHGWHGPSAFYRTIDLRPNIHFPQRLRTPQRAGAGWFQKTMLQTAWLSLATPRVEV